MASQPNDDSIGFFDLLDELESPDNDRREAAETAHHWLSRLVAMRSHARGTIRIAGWLAAFDPGALVRDFPGQDELRARVAFEALDAISLLEGLRAVANYQPTPDDRIWADKLRARVQLQLDELRY